MIKNNIDKLPAQANESNTRYPRTAIMIQIALALLAIVGWALFVVRSAANTQEAAAAQSRQAIMVATQSSINDRLSQIEATATAQAQALDTEYQKAKILQTNIDQLTGEKNDLQANVDRLTGDVAKYKDLYQKSSGDFNILKSNTDALENTINCDETTDINFDYSSNETISANLADFVGEVSSKADKATWDVLWSNVKDSVHYVYGKYKAVFFVTFNDSKMRHGNSIYWFDRACFLDRSPYQNTP